MHTIPKSIRLQSAADDAYQIGEAVEALSSMLDRFCETHGEELGAQIVNRLRKRMRTFGPPAAKKLYAFPHSLEPRED